jgi:integrase
VCWRENGRDRSRTFAFRKDADRFRVEVERRLQLGELYEAPPITLAAARESWKDRWQIGKAASTVKRKDEAWPHVQKLAEMPLGALTPAMLEDAIADAARVAPRQAQLALGTVKHVLRDAMKRGERANPALLEVKAPGYEEREPVFLSAAEVEHLASWCAEPRLIVFTALSGLRLGEVLASRDADVNLEDGSVLVRRSARKGVEGRTKTRKRRRVYLCARALKAAREQLLARRPNPNGRLPVTALKQCVELGQFPCRRVRQGGQACRSHA